jgi:Reverse transcriptase (RNA-dependent DNA polymerase)
MTCVSNSRITIKVNGGTNDSFITHRRGLRQGCPLFSYSFIMTMEVLSYMLTRAQHEGGFRGVRLTPQASPLTHIFYADDVVLFGLVEEQEANMVATTLDLFGKLSGLRVNREKSII